MRNTISRAIVGGLAALSLAASLVATAEPASAAQWHGGGGGWHGGGWPAGRRAATPVGMAAATGTLATGAGACGTTAIGARRSQPDFALGAVAAYPYYGYGGGYDACWQNRPVYSAGGAYLGYQMVNVCQ